jgi:hypothetical protein
VAQWLRPYATNRQFAGSIPDCVIGIFQWHKPSGRLRQKWVPGVFPGGKGGRCVRLSTLSPSCAVVMKSRNLNFLEPSGPLQACNGTALPLPLPLPFTLTCITSHHAMLIGMSSIRKQANQHTKLLSDWLTNRPTQPTNRRPVLLILLLILTWRTIPYIYLFISILYMFRATLCSSSGESISVSGTRPA